MKNKNDLVEEIEKKIYSKIKRTALIVFAIIVFIGFHFLLYYALINEPNFNYFWLIIIPYVSFFLTAILFFVLFMGEMT